MQQHFHFHFPLLHFIPNLALQNPPVHLLPSFRDDFPQGLGSRQSLFVLHCFARRSTNL